MGLHERAATKLCKVCLQTKSITEFYGGIRRRCKKCICAAMKLRYQDPEVRAQGIAKCARYYEQNRESLLAQKSEYGRRKSVAERDKSRRRERYATDQAFRTATKRRRDRYYSENSHVFRARDAKRRAWQLKATPAWADAKAIKDFYRRAALLSEQTGATHEVDHIVPLQGRGVCGLHVENNLQILPRTANRKKFNKLVEDIV